MTSWGFPFAGYALGPAAVLQQTANAQPALLTASIACQRVLAANGIEAGMYAGHSLGEYWP